MSDALAAWLFFGAFGALVVWLFWVVITAGMNR